MSGTIRAARSRRPAAGTGVGLLVAVFVAACAGASGTSPSPAASTAATPTPSTTAAVVPSPDPGDEPPAALLQSGDGSASVPGDLGSYTWRGAGSDAPWLPGAAAIVPATAAIDVSLAGHTSVESWSALVAPANDALGAQARTAGSGAGTIRIDPPSPGAWTLAVHVVFGDGLGDAAYYWRLTVR